MAGLAPDPPARGEGERGMARLERVGLLGEERGEGLSEGERPRPSRSLDGERGR